MKFLDLFSGIGGFTWGLEAIGMECIAHVENDPDCQKVLKYYWPNTAIFSDVKDLEYYGTENNKCMALDDGSTYLKTDIEIIVGGYPCTGHSVAGKKKGFENAGSSLWSEYFRLIKEIRPKYCIIENSPNLRGTGLAELLSQVNEIGYNAEWSVLSAYSVGSPHQRERLFIVLWRGDIPYCNPFRWWEADPQKKKASSGWWAERLFKRPLMFKQISKIESRILQFDDGVSKEIFNENKIKIQQLGNAVIPTIPMMIGSQLMKNEERANE